MEVFFFVLLRNARDIRILNVVRIGLFIHSCQCRDAIGPGSNRQNYMFVEMIMMLPTDKLNDDPTTNENKYSIEQQN